MSLPGREDWRPNHCDDLTATFSGRSKPAHFKPEGHLTIREIHKYQDKDYAEIAECGCLDYGDLTKASRYFLTGSLAASFEQRDLRVKRMSLVEGSPLGKFTDFDTTAATPQGDATTDVRMIWRGQCYFALTAAWLNPSDATRGMQFINSVRDRNGATAVGTATKPSTPADPPVGDAAKRLQKLKDLYDRELITPSEYESKRKAILDGI